MVKWLSEITVTKEESDNFFHYNDNRCVGRMVRWLSVRGCMLVEVGSGKKGQLVI